MSSFSSLDRHLPSQLISGLAVLGAATVAYGLTWTVRNALIYLRPSSLPRYLHCSDGSWALVTGASDGIGRCFAEELLSQGFNVVLHGRNKSKLQVLRDKLGKTYDISRISILIADATDLNTDFTAIKRQLQDLPGKLTVLINNVGGIHSRRMYQRLDKYTKQELVDCINVNATFTTCVTSALLPLLISNGPSLILNCGSIVETICPPYIATYVGAKSFLHGWSSALRAELEAESLHNQVEVLTVAIGNTSSSTNTHDEAGATMTAGACAKACLDRVGCGRAIVVPHPRYLASAIPMSILPTGMTRRALLPIMKKRYEAEQRIDDAAE